MFGLTAREVRNETPHVFSEYFDTELDQWVFIDSLWLVQARDKRRELLSTADIRRIVIEDGFVDSYDIRTGTSIAPNDWPLQYKERDGVSPWLDLSLPLGNNVFSEDSVARRLSFLPRPLMQTTGLITGRMPHYLYLADDVSDRRQERERTHFLLLVGGTAFGVLLLSYPLAYIVGLLPRFVSMACRRLIKNWNPRLSQRSR